MRTIIWQILTAVFDSLVQSSNRNSSLIAFTLAAFGLNAQGETYSYQDQADIKTVGWKNEEPYEVGFDETELLALQKLNSPSWKLFRFPRTVCMNNTQTTLGINDHGQDPSQQKNLLIYFQSGNACFNGLTCETASSSNGYDKPEFIQQMFDSENSEAEGPLAYDGRGAFDRGVFNSQHPKNPFARYSYVAVPYCSGDAFVGSMGTEKHGDLTTPLVIKGHGLPIPGANFKTDKRVVFRGYFNVKEYIKFLRDRYPQVKNLVIMGQSAGSVGATYNFSQFYNAFNLSDDGDGKGVRTNLTLVDDSGFTLIDKDVNPCASALLKDVWSMSRGLNEIFSSENTPFLGSAFMDDIRHKNYSLEGAKIAHVRSLQDRTIKLFYWLAIKEYQNKMDETCEYPNTFPNNGVRLLDALNHFYQQANQEHIATVRTWMVFNRHHQWIMGTGAGKILEPWEVEMFHKDSSKDEIFTLADWLQNMADFDASKEVDWHSFHLNWYRCLSSKEYRFKDGQFSELCHSKGSLFQLSSEVISSSN